MPQIETYQKTYCRVLAVYSGKLPEQYKAEEPQSVTYPVPELVSAGRLQVHQLVNPTVEEFKNVQQSINPTLLYVRGNHQGDQEEIGSLIWGGVDVSQPHVFNALLVAPLPTIVFLEVPYGEKMAKALRLKGIPYVIYWKSEFLFNSASHFRQAFFSVIQSSCSHTWDAFQLAHASYRLYCVRNNHVMPTKNQEGNVVPGPRIMGSMPKVNIPQKLEVQEQNLSDIVPSVKVYDDYVDVRFLMCGESCKLDASLLCSLEDGLNALLKIEIRGSQIINRSSTAPPAGQVEALSSEVVTVRCDLVTSSYAHISLLVSGSEQICFNDELLDSHIKDQLIHKNQLVKYLTNENDLDPDPRLSASIACGASTFEVRMKVPSWAVQVMKDLACDVNHRSLVALGIAAVQGMSVASFESRDADCLLFFCNGQKGKDASSQKNFLLCPQSWSAALVKERSRPTAETTVMAVSNAVQENGLSRHHVHENLISDLRETKYNVNELSSYAVGNCSNPVREVGKLKLAALRPIPRSRKLTLFPFQRPEANSYQEKPERPKQMLEHHGRSDVSSSISGYQRRSSTTPVREQPKLPDQTPEQQKMSSELVPRLKVKLAGSKRKHDCRRSPIQDCTRDEFLEDLLQFLTHARSRLVPKGGLSEFPEAILNAKRLDLFNLYREVVSRGGFEVANGINWKGQVFPKMRNYSNSNKMTGVSNALKKHYKTYLLEYEQAHDDIDGECCLLCHSGAPGDWVNCGTCGEWVHFGCDPRQGLAAFRDYAKTDGLEYTCPQCSLPTTKRMAMMNGV